MLLRGNGKGLIQAKGLKPLVFQYREEAKPVRLEGWSDRFGERKIQVAIPACAVKIADQAISQIRSDT